MLLVRIGVYGREGGFWDPTSRDSLHGAYLHVQQLEPQIFDLGNVLCRCRLRLFLLARAFNSDRHALLPNRFQALYVSLQLKFRFCQYLSEELSNSPR